MYVTRLARKIPTSPAHPIKENRTLNYKYTHTAYKDNSEQEKTKISTTLTQYSNI